MAFGGSKAGLSSQGILRLGNVWDKLGNVSGLLNQRIYHVQIGLISCTLDLAVQRSLRISDVGGKHAVGTGPGPAAQRGLALMQHSAAPSPAGGSASSEPQGLCQGQIASHCNGPIGKIPNIVLRTIRWE
eukprot:691319-Pelagomonas_calceolata.AAC.1